jgi:lipopolysaccharide transport system permease protein
VLGAKLGGVDNEAGYAIYLMSGIACWSLFSEIANRSMTIFIEYGAAMKKIAFPRIALPLIVLGGAVINQTMLLSAIAVVFAFFGHYPGVEWFGVLVGAFAAALFGFGVGMLCGVFNVFLRDTGQVMSVVFQVWFWLTPIVYTREALPDNMRGLIDKNPMTPIVAVYQDALLRHQWPDLGALVAPLGFAAALAVAALLVFRRASPELVDAL